MIDRGLEPWYLRMPMDCKKDCEHFRNNFTGLIFVDEDGNVAPDGMNCCCKYCEKIVAECGTKMESEKQNNG